MTGTFNDLNKNYRFDKDSEKQDSYNLVAAVSRPVKDGGPPKPDAKAETPKPGDKRFRGMPFGTVAI